MNRITWVLVWLAPFQVLATENGGIAVLDIQGTRIDQDLLPTLTEILTVEVDSLGFYKVIAGRDIEAMLGFEKQKEVIGCDDTACLAEIGGALGVDRLLASHIGKVGSTYVVNIKLINIRKATTEGRAYKTVRGEQDALIETIRRSVNEVLGPDSNTAKAVAQVSGKPEPAPAAEPTAPSPQAAPEPDAIPRSTREPSEQLATAEPAPAPQVGRVEHVEQEGNAGSGLPIGPLVVGGAGLAGLGLGIGMGVKARGQAECANDPRCSGGQFAASEAKRSALISTVSYAVGGAALAGGVVWLIVRLVSDDQFEETAAMVPLVTPASAGVAFSGRF